MKKILGIIAITGLMASAQAQQIERTEGSKQHSGRHHKAGHQQMIQQLNLTAEQQSTLKANQASFREKMKTLKQNESITVKEMRDQQYALRQQQKASFEKLLTNDQRNQLALLKKQQKEKHAQKHAQKLARLKSNLQLSDTQAASLQSQHERNSQKLDAIKSNSSLSRTEKRDQIAAIKKEQADNMKSILTKDQWEKWQTMKAQKPAKNKVK